MKSKKVKNWLAEKEVKEWSYCGIDVSEAVEIAESEMREKAISTYANLCKFNYDGKCRLSDFHAPCTSIRSCDTKNIFISKLDE